MPTLRDDRRTSFLTEISAWQHFSEIDRTDDADIGTVAGGVGQKLVFNKAPASRPDLVTATVKRNLRRCRPVIRTDRYVARDAHPCGRCLGCERYAKARRDGRCRRGGKSGPEDGANHLAQDNSRRVRQPNRTACRIHAQHGAPDGAVGINLELEVIAGGNAKSGAPGKPV